MGWKLERCDLCLEPNEEKDLDITLRPEKRAAIHGVVRFPDGSYAKNAVVKLFVKKDKCKLIPVTFAFTDECGQFLFGVKSGLDYVVKVFFYTPEKHHHCDDKADHKDDHCKKGNCKDDDCDDYGLDC